MWKTDGVTVALFAIDEHGTGIGSPSAETDDGRVAGAAGGAVRLCVVGQLSRHSCRRRRAHRALARRAAGTGAESIRDRRPHLRRGRRGRARHVRRRDPRGAAAAASPPGADRGRDAAAAGHRPDRPRRPAARVQRARIGQDQRQFRRPRLLQGPGRPQHRHLCQRRAHAQSVERRHRFLRSVAAARLAGQVFPRRDRGRGAAEIFRGFLYFDRPAARQLLRLGARRRLDLGALSDPRQPRSAIEPDERAAHGHRPRRHHRHFHRQFRGRRRAPAHRLPQACRLPGLCAGRYQHRGDQPRMVGSHGRAFDLRLAGDALAVRRAVVRACAAPSACTTKPSAAKWRKARCTRRSNSKPSAN